LGESLASVEKLATPLSQATTPSLEALKAYSLGRKIVITKGQTASLPFHKRAVELDPDFAAAYNALASTYRNLNEGDRAQENARKAYELRDRVSERERLAFEGSYYFFATGELEKAAHVYELQHQTYPTDMVALQNLGVIYSILGNPEESLEKAREAMRLEGSQHWLFGNLADACLSLNRLDEAEAMFDQAEEHKLYGGDLLEGRYPLAFLKGDTSEMARLAAAALGKPGVEDEMLATQSDTEAWYGKFKNARGLSRRAMDSAQRNDARESAAAYQALAALREAAAGNRRQTRAEADAALKLAPNRNVRAMAALALAKAGDTAGAERQAGELDKAFPLDTIAQRYWLPTIGAAVALQRNDPSRAVELLKVTSTIELGQPTSSVALCPVYLRGEAYLMLHDGEAAAGEFRKFIDHYGLVVNFPWGALARLGLARAYAVEAQTDPSARGKARAAYKNFLTLWKDADPDVPIYEQAKAEYAKLN
jgi:tetratricopeptide (TPR) repeat protein